MYTPALEAAIKEQLDEAFFSDEDAPYDEERKDGNDDDDNDDDDCSSGEEEQAELKEATEEQN